MRLSQSISWESLQNLKNSEGGGKSSYQGGSRGKGSARVSGPSNH